MRDVVPDTGKHAVAIGPGEMRCMVGAAACGEQTVAVAIQGDGWHADGRLQCQRRFPRFQRRVTGYQAKSVPVGMHHYVYKVRVVERRGGGGKRGVAELPRG